MPLSKVRKEELIDDYLELLENSKAIIFTEYRGLTNTQLTKLRRAVRDAQGQYRVAKLTLLKRAMEEKGYAIPDELAGVPFAVGFCIEEVPSVAKALTEFAKENDAFVVRGGMMENSYLTEKQVKALAELPPLDVVRAQLLGLLDTPAANLVGVIQAGVAQVVNVLHAYVEQGEEAA